MNKHAGIDVAVRIDMQIPSSAGNAAFGEFAVILEIHAEDRLGLPVFPDLMIDILSLFRSEHQFRHRILSDRHIVEIPDKVSAPGHCLVVESFAGNTFKILAGITCGNSERQAL